MTNDVSAAGEDALTLARALIHNALETWALADKYAGQYDQVAVRQAGSVLITPVAAALDAAYARGRAAGPVADEATVERVAERICEALSFHMTEPLQHWMGYQDAARAALAAIPAPPAGEPDRG